MNSSHPELPLSTKKFQYLVHKCSVRCSAPLCKMETLLEVSPKPRSIWGDDNLSQSSWLLLGSLQFFFFRKGNSNVYTRRFGDVSMWLTYSLTFQHHIFNHAFLAIQRRNQRYAGLISSFNEWRDNDYDTALISLRRNLYFCGNMQQTRLYEICLDMNFNFAPQALTIKKYIIVIYWFTNF